MDDTVEAITYTAIGIVRSPFTALAGMPLQTIAAQGVRGAVELEPAFREGLKDLEGFSHVILLTHLHLMAGFALKEVTPSLSITGFVMKSEFTRWPSKLPIRWGCRWCGSSPSRAVRC